MISRWHGLRCHGSRRINSILVEIHGVAGCAPLSIERNFLGGFSQIDADMRCMGCLRCPAWPYCRQASTLLLPSAAMASRHHREPEASSRTMLRVNKQYISQSRVQLCILRRILACGKAGAKKGIHKQQAKRPFRMPAASDSRRTEAFQLQKGLSLYKPDAKLLAAGVDDPAKPGHKNRRMPPVHRKTQGEDCSSPHLGTNGIHSGNRPPDLMSCR